VAAMQRTKQGEERSETIERGAREDAVGPHLSILYVCSGDMPQLKMDFPGLV